MSRTKVHKGVCSCTLEAGQDDDIRMASTTVKADWQLHCICELCTGQQGKLNMTIVAMLSGGHGHSRAGQNTNLCHLQR